MPPVVAAVAAIATAVGSFITAVAGFQIFGFTVGRLLISAGLSLLSQALFAPKRASVGERQAQIAEMSLGEGPREGWIGNGMTGGRLLNGWNDGAENEFETLVIRLADHEIFALDRFLIEDKSYTLTAQGAQSHADFQDGGPRLWIEWSLGAPNTPVCPIIANQGVAAGQWTAEEVATSFKGIAYVVVRYQISDKVWKSGRPRFQWIGRGAKLYDPRKDSTVTGGSGSHRWGEPSTYEFSDNARLGHYNYIRGIWNYQSDPPQIIIGPGRSAEEAPPELVIADANVCDEDVALKAGGTEKRYRAGGIISAAERWIDIEEHFAAAMGGQLVERAGAIGVDPGVAKVVEFEFDDGDLLAKQPMRYQAKVGRSKLTNSVIARYVEPALLYGQNSAPIRRSLEDIAEDGEARDETIDLVLVQSGTQAQRCAEIKRRRGRLQPNAIIPLGPRAMRLEDGDWVGWTSARRFGGDQRTFEVLGVEHLATCDVRIAISQTAASVYSWNPATDELDPNDPAYLAPGAPGAASIADFDAEPLEITSESGVSSGGIRATWTPPNDITITGVRLEYRPKGGVASISITVPPQLGEYVIATVPVVDVDYEIRATPETFPRRDTLTTAWRDVMLSAPFNAPQPPLNFVGYQTNDTLIRFVWTPYTDTSLQYEIREGENFDLGRFVARTAGGATTVPWPISAEEGALFWIKTLHRSGVYSNEASLWRAVPNLDNPNFILVEDFQAEDFPGVRHRMSVTNIGGESVLELAQVDGVSRPRGDYYAALELASTFNARSWSDHRAAAYVDDLPTWEGTENTWEEFGDDDFVPAIGDAGGDASISAYIALNETSIPTALIEGFRFNDTTTGARGAIPDVATGVAYAPARTANGVTATALEYEIEHGEQFSTLFDKRLGTKPTTDKTLIELTDDGDASAFLRVVWRAEDERFVIEGHYGPEIAFALPWVDDDTVSVSLWQSTTARGAVIASIAYPTPLSGSALLQ